MRNDLLKFLKLALILLFTTLFSCSKNEVRIYLAERNSPRSAYGAEKLGESLTKMGFKVVSAEAIDPEKKGYRIIIGETNNPSLSELQRSTGTGPLVNGIPESYNLYSSGDLIIIRGSDPSGTMYGCLELAGMVERNGHLPVSIDRTESPEMVLRGAAVGLQKPDLLPGRAVYEYPVTPENFPWFYDKQLWIEYLDLLVGNRMNSLYLWNGHPFASLVKLDDYPYAVEVSDSVFELNREIYSFLTTEADRRGIWVIQMFYNIIVSKPFAAHYGIETQRRSRPITPLLSDYTRKSVAAFIENFPNVGLMVCLGEAMNTIEDDITWFTETIIPGVKDGLEALGKSEYPPIILRGHDTDAGRVMENAIPIYPKLYTTYKYNGESLTTYEPGADWVRNNQALGRLGSVHISNVHILANLEPFRYGSPDFIMRSTRAMHDLYGANGLHLYPQSGYWDWPYTADNTNPRLLQIERDWPWYSAWGRYAWNSRRDSISEIDYWSREFGRFYGNEQAGMDILEAYEESGEIAPKILRKFGITDGNRQTLLLGMFMSQLVNPGKWRVYESFINSNGPPGERLEEYARKEANEETHSGETPLSIIEEIIDHGVRAKQAINRAESMVKENREEFLRLKNDIYCYDAFARFFYNKVMAALKVLNYRYTGNRDALSEALPWLEKSVECFTELSELTENTYLYANSMQTSQRRIPVDGTDGMNKTWKELLPQYKKELGNFRNNITGLIKNEKDLIHDEREILMPAVVSFPDKSIRLTAIRKNTRVYSDQDFTIVDFTPEIKNLSLLQLNYNEQVEKGTRIRFKNENNVKLLIGYFNGHSYRILSPPTLETDASANDRGQADIKIANAMTIYGLYPVNVYSYSFEPGDHELVLDKGIVLVLGFMDGDQEIKTFDAGIGSDGLHAVDWLFY